MVAGRARALWLAVLVVGCTDAAKAGDADDWIGSADFDLVCDLAQIDPDHVAHRFREIASRARTSRPKAAWGRRIAV